MKLDAICRSNLNFVAMSEDNVHIYDLPVRTNTYHLELVYIKWFFLFLRPSMLLGFAASAFP